MDLFLLPAQAFPAHPILGPPASPPAHKLRFFFQALLRYSIVFSLSPSPRIARAIGPPRFSLRQELFQEENLSTHCDSPYPIEKNAAAELAERILVRQRTSCLKNVPTQCWSRLRIVAEISREGVAPNTLRRRQNTLGELKEPCVYGENIVAAVRLIA